jgi:predicted RNA binding protein YcfA (HicA-like mRNA interferase family)
MSKPGRQPQHNQRSLQRLLEANGWTKSVGGKHSVKMIKPGHRPITLPHDKGGGGYAPGLTAAILRQAGLK